jgi:hypothetical protein
MAYDWSARCTAEGCRYGVRTGSYAVVGAKAARHAKAHSHVMELSQGGSVRLSIPSPQSAARCESTLPYGF